MCRCLIKSIEEVEKLIVSSVPTLVETWINGFGFPPLEEDERRSLSKINLMVLFPGSVWLKKHLYESHTMDEKGLCTALASDLTEVGAFDGGPTVDCGQLSLDNLSVEEANTEAGICISDPENLQSSKGQDCGILQNEPSKLSSEEQEPRPSVRNVSVEETTILTGTLNGDSEIVLSNEEKEWDVMLNQRNLMIRSVNNWQIPTCLLKKQILRQTIYVGSGSDNVDIEKTTLQRFS